jgi:dephospho-CoA kinase
MVIIGLAGGIATGKNFIAEYFKKRNINIFDADEEVHKLLANTSSNVYSRTSALFPECISEGKISREILGRVVFSNPQKLQQLENIIYPELTKKLDAFITNNKDSHKKIIVINAPTLYKAQWDKKCDYVIFLYADTETAKERYFERGDKEIERFENIQKNQISTEQGKKRADFSINTTKSQPIIIQKIGEIINKISKNEK